MERLPASDSTRNAETAQWSTHTNETPPVQQQLSTEPVGIQTLGDYLCSVRTDIARSLERSNQRSRLKTSFYIHDSIGRSSEDTIDGELFIFKRTLLGTVPFHFNLRG